MTCARLTRPRLVLLLNFVFCHIDSPVPLKLLGRETIRDLIAGTPRAARFENFAAFPRFVRICNASFPVSESRMDSEESRGGAAADASSDGEGDASDASGSSPYSSRESKPQNQRRSNPRSPESPDNYRSDNSTVDSPENFRPPSPPSNPNPSSPNPSNSAPASPRLDSPTDDSSTCANKTQKEPSEKKWSPKSDSCSGQNTRSPDSVAQNSPEKSRRRSRSDSSGSSRESGRRARTSRSNDPPTEEISEGTLNVFIFSVDILI